MVYSGASHNFIFQKFVSGSKLLVHSTSSFFVKLGDGHRVLSTEICRNLQLPAHSYYCGLLCFSSKRVDLILGVSWLEKLGDVQVFCWKHVTFSFLFGASQITL